MALSSAAVLAVYGAGFFRTRSAAEQFAAEASRRRPAAATASAPGRPPARATSIPAASTSLAIAHAADIPPT